MPTQYLINSDGSIPEGAPLEALAAAGVPLVVPTLPPQAPEGQCIIEDEPVQDALGIWRQAWRTEPAPEPEPVVEAVPDLSRPQFEYLLALTGLETIWDTLEAAVKGEHLQLYAMLRGSRVRETFRFEVTLEMIESFRPFLPEGFALDEETLRPLWLQAAAF